MIGLARIADKPGQGTPGLASCGEKIATELEFSETVGRIQLYQAVGPKATSILKSVNKAPHVRGFLPLPIAKGMLFYEVS